MICPSIWPKKLGWDIEAFIEAFVQAIEIHKGKYEGDVDPQMLSTSIGEARALARRQAMLQAGRDKSRQGSTTN
jgi:hypothetical protein